MMYDCGPLENNQQRLPWLSTIKYQILLETDRCTLTLPHSSFSITALNLRSSDFLLLFKSFSSLLLLLALLLLLVLPQLSLLLLFPIVAWLWLGCGCGGGSGGSNNPCFSIFGYSYFVVAAVIVIDDSSSYLHPCVNVHSNFLVLNLLLCFYKL